MKPVKIPDGWYELPLYPSLEIGDWQWDAHKEMWVPIPIAYVGFKGATYIRRMDYKEAERARLDPQYRSDYQKPVMAKETASPGILAAVKEILTFFPCLEAGDGIGDGPHTRSSSARIYLQETIARHCVGKEALDACTPIDWSKEPEVEFAFAAIRREVDTQKARADNLQAEMEDLQRQLKHARDCSVLYKNKLQAIKETINE